MESTFEEFENSNQTPQRTDNLKILCILSFIMCGLMILIGLYNLYQMQPEIMEKQIEQLRQVYPEMADKMETQMELMKTDVYTQLSPYLSIVFYVLSLFGVILMWNLKRNGFYIYAIAEILPYFSFLFMPKGSLNAMGGGMITGGMVMTGIVLMITIDLIFVFLYSRETKNMS